MDRAKLLELAEQVEGFPLRKCSPSDDPDMQTAYLYGFREVAKRFVAAAERFDHPSLNRHLQDINTAPDYITDAYDLLSELQCVIDALRELPGGSPMGGGQVGLPSAQGGQSVLFSQRYYRALKAGTLVVDIPDECRTKLWVWLRANNHELYIQRDKWDDWKDRTSVVQEAGQLMRTEQGWEVFPDATPGNPIDDMEGVRGILLRGRGEWVLDMIELAGNLFDAEEREALRVKANQLFAMHACPWRLSDGEFFKLDTDFMGAQLAAEAHDALAVNRFDGAADEYAKARQYLGTGETREAIYYAGHSFESVMKVLTGTEGNADLLIKQLGADGYFDDLPEGARSGFAEQVLKTLPNMRNKFGGHGQGAAVVSIPPIYAELAVQLAAVFHNFLLAKHLERKPAKPEPASRPTLDDEIPF